MEDSSTQKNEKKYILLKSVSSIAKSLTIIKLLITLFPYLLDMLGTSQFAAYNLIYRVTTVLILPGFYNVISCLWLITAFLAFYQDNNYEIFKKSFLLMGVCLTLFCSLETGVYREMIIYLTNALSF